jgi:tetratricopeptide (TPR) repeat protein
MGLRVLLAVVLLSPAYAQMNMAGHVMEMQDEIPPENLPQPVRIDGIGNSHMQITANAEAQKWFDQGLNLLHDFWDYESARAFQQGVRVDPQCAMCYWGLYKAESFYHSTAQGYAGQAIAKAVGLKEHVSARERLYIEAAVAREERAYPREQELLRKIVADYPDDVQGRIFLSNAGGGLAILEAVLKDDPENSAANHYYIHALEGTDHPEKALHSAEILGRLAPASGHMVHMPGHIYYRVGDYARAEQAFGAAVAADERYMREQHVAPDDNWNYVHNLMYAVANLLEEGKLEEATRLSGRITAARGKLETTLYINLTRDSISRLDPRLPVALRTADFEQIGKLANASVAGPGLPNLEFLRKRLAEFAAGMGAVTAGKVAEAEKVSGRFEAELARISEQAKEFAPMPGMRPAGSHKLAVMSDAQIGPVLKSLSIMSLELRGSVLAAKGKADEAKALFATAAKEQKALGYREPPNYIRPVGEAEGAAMLGAGKWADAKAAFERALVDRPHSGFALYGAAVASERAGDEKAAVKTYAEFLSAWKDADAGLSQLAHARAYVAAHGQ